jgi:hypothetical protein
VRSEIRFFKDIIPYLFKRRSDDSSLAERAPLTLRALASCQAFVTFYVLGTTTVQQNSLSTRISLRERATDEVDAGKNRKALVSLLPPRQTLTRLYVRLRICSKSAAGNATIEKR